MKKFFQKMALLALTGCIALSAQATTPDEDLDAFQNFFKNRFPGVAMEEYTNGVYSIDPIGRDNWKRSRNFHHTSLSSRKVKRCGTRLLPTAKATKIVSQTALRFAAKYPHWDEPQANQSQHCQWQSTSVVKTMAKNR